MSYGIYLLKAHHPSALGLDEFPMQSHTSLASAVHDTRFLTFGKTTLEVKVDLFKFLAEQLQDKMDRRVPDDLELMYTTEMKPIEGHDPDMEVVRSFRELDLDHKHRELDSMFSGCSLECVAMLPPSMCDLIDEAREIVRDGEVTRALALASNPRGRVTELNGLIHDIDRKSKRCVSYSAMSDQDFSAQELQAAVTAYTNFLATMRIIAHPSQKES
jgi:hypothetical protein